MNERRSGMSAFGAHLPKPRIILTECSCYLISVFPVTLIRFASHIG